MRERIEKLCDTKEIHVGTFHSISLKILQKYYKEAGLRESFSILMEPAKLVRKIPNINNFRKW
jgi:superfamily I DNA/RNA helicase